MARVIWKGSCETALLARIEETAKKGASKPVRRRAGAR